MVILIMEFLRFLIEKYSMNSGELISLVSSSGSTCMIEARRAIESS